MAAFIGASSMLALLLSANIGRTYEQRAGQYFAEIVSKARAEFARANAAPMPSRDKLDAAARFLVEARAGLRARKEELAAIAADQPRSPGALDRLRDPLGRAYRVEQGAHKDRIDSAERAVENAEQRLRTAEIVHGRAERALSAAFAARDAHIAEMQRNLSDTMARIEMSRRIVRAYPQAVFAGPKFISWAGRQSEQARRHRSEIMNPQAKTIWGLPIEYGP